MNWDDLKYFLAVFRTGSIRAASVYLGVNHATVLRRVNNFERRFGQQLFDRSAKGYLPTLAAQEIFQEASHLEDRLNAVARKVEGKDKTLHGNIRVTLPDAFGLLLMDDFSDFCRLYPQIELEIIDSGRSFNLVNREADVAIRLCNQAPQHLVGRQLATMHRACYMAKSSMPFLQKEGWLEQQNWIGWSDKHRRPVGRLAKEYLKFESKHKIGNSLLQAEACKQGMGIAVLPCFMGDSDPLLTRVPPYTSEEKIELWILCHSDVRTNLKVQTFVRFMTERVERKRTLIEGETYEPSPI